MTDFAGISFNGDGYAVMNMSAWNPRKRTDFNLAFRTYAKEGMLMYLGKDVGVHFVLSIAIH
jgi:hypothetical protein